MVVDNFNPAAPDTGGFDRELIDEGPYAARCTRVIEIGRQESDYGVQNKVVIALNLPDVTINIGGEDKQRMLSHPFGINMSNNKNSSMRMYTDALNPNASKLGDFLDCTAQVMVKHGVKKDGNPFEKIDSIAPLLASIEVAASDIPQFWFEWNNPDPAVWAQIPQFTRDLIVGTEKYSGAINYPGSYVEEMVVAFNENSLDQDIPF